MTLGEFQANLMWIDHPHPPDFIYLEMFGRYPKIVWVHSQILKKEREESWWKIRPWACLKQGSWHLAAYIKLECYSHYESEVKKQKKKKQKWKTCPLIQVSSLDTFVCTGSWMGEESSSGNSNSRLKNAVRKVLIYTTSVV